MDRRYLDAVAISFGGGPVGIETIAAALSEPRDAIEDIIEPYLIQLGFLQRTPRGRHADPARLPASRAAPSPGAAANQFGLFDLGEDRDELSGARIACPSASITRTRISPAWSTTRTTCASSSAAAPSCCATSASTRRICYAGSDGAAARLRGART